jgi:dTDP-4-amino-4,6-dideoxygalactose transaminase
MGVVAMKVPFLDLRVSSEERTHILQAVERVLTHGRFIIGPEVAEFEAAVAKHCRRKFAVGTGSGTDALFLALKALHIGSGDEVITTSLSWIATTNAIAMTGATPVFADIGDDLNIDPKSVEKLITPKTKAILPVHFTGRMCDMNALEKISKKYRILLIEDACQAFGAEYQSKPAGSFGDIACFSMNPMKVLAACGEAGVVLTDDAETYQRLTALRYNGTINKEQCIETSLNGRLDTIQAAILLHRMDHVDQIISKRREVAAFYKRRLSPYVRVPLDNQKDVYYTYQIQAAKRDALKSFLEERGIETKIQYSILMCQQSIYKKYLRLPVPNAERLSQETLCLPMHEKLSMEEQEHVVDSIQSFYS